MVERSQLGTTVQTIYSLLSLSIPILITQLAQAGAGFIDTVMAGRISAQDLAAVSLGVGLWLPVMLLLTGILFATTPLISQSLGANNRIKIPFITWQSLWLAVGLGLLGFVVLNLMPECLSVLKVPLALQSKTTLFVRGVSLGLPAVALFTVLRCYTESLGAARAVTVISLIGLLLVIPLNIVFMYGFGLGGAGSGLSTAAGEWVALIALVIYVSVAKRFDDVRLWQNRQSIVWKQVLKTLKLGLPIGLSVFFEVSLFSMAALILAPLGSQTVASHQVAISLTGQLFMVPLSLALALTILVGQCFGSERSDDLRRVLKVGAIMATLGAGMTMLVLGVFGQSIARFYTHDAAVQTLAAHLMLYAMLYQLVDAWQVTISGSLRGLQDTFIPMLITFGSYWLVGFPLGIWAARVAGYGAAGVWVAMAASLAVAALLLGIRLLILVRRYTTRWTRAALMHSTPSEVLAVESPPRADCR